MLCDYGQTLNGSSKIKYVLRLQIFTLDCFYNVQQSIFQVFTRTSAIREMPKSREILKDKPKFV